MKAALDLPHVFVTRTFSKAYGMAGMRMGYAIGQPETLRKLSNAWGLGDIDELQAVAGIAALADQKAVPVFKKVLGTAEDSISGSLPHAPVTARQTRP